MESPDAPQSASSHHLMDSLDAPAAAKAFPHGGSRQGLVPRPPAVCRPVATPAAKASSYLPVAPSSQVFFEPPPPHGQPGRTAASWAGKASSHRPVASSSQGLFPPPPPHRQPGRGSWTHRQPKAAASRQIPPRRLMVRPVAPPSPHRLMDSPDASAASKVSSHRYPNWVMLDPHTRLNYHPDEDFLCTHAIAETSMGEHIDVSFRTVTPPGASRLYVSWTPRGGTKGESSSGAGRGEDRWDQFNGREPIVVAAHGNSVLLQLTFENAQSDFFLYTLPASGPPSLMLLPSCNHKFSDGTPYSSGLDHMFRIEEIGLLCNTEKEKFVVADLMILPSAYKDDGARVVAELCVLQGSCSKDGWTTTPWRAILPPIHHDKDQGKELMWWETDVVVPLRGSLCYVDYYRGIFFVDVLSRNPKLDYVRLPVTIPDGDPVDPETGLRGCPELYRSVCVTNDGCIVKFVEVVTTIVFVSDSRAPASSSFSMNVWKLTQDSMTWEKEYVMDDTDLWALQGCGDLLRVTPSFPLMSMEEPNVVYFVLSNNDADTSWVIVVDMLKKTMRSLSRYNKVYPNCIGSDSDMASASLTTNSAFIPCALSKYLQMCA